MSLSVFIISDIKDPNEVVTTLRQRMFSIQVDLVSKGFVVFNPMDIVDQFRSKKISKNLFFKRKLELLYQANAVYVMSNIDLKNNIELQIANRLNLIIIQPTVYLPQ
jgi:hypothetical protein